MNGPKPSHAEMDKHLEKIGAARGRILESVWYVGTPQTQAQLLDHIKLILGTEDLLLVVQATSATWTKLLVENEPLLAAWKANA